MKIRNLEFPDLDDIMEKISLDHNIVIKSSGNNIQLCCPFHGETRPSAGINKDTGVFHCFACDKVASLEDVIYEFYGVDGFQWLLDNFMHTSARDIKIFDDEQSNAEYIDKSELKKYQFIHQYMLNRKISKNILIKFDVGYDKEDKTITFPNKDENGNITCIMRRSIKGKHFYIPENSKKTLYGLYEINQEVKKGKKIDSIYIVEAIIDALSIWSWGKYAIALNGLGSSEQVEMLKSLPFREYILATDNDKHGKQAREKLKKKLYNKFIREIDYKSYGDCKDINDMTKEQFLECNLI